MKQREREEKENLQKQQEQDDNNTEMANHIYGDILTENPSVAQSAFGAHRVIPDRWKGMSPQQLEDIRKQQELQRKEKEVGILLNIITCITLSQVNDYYHLVICTVYYLHCCEQKWS